VKQGHNKSRASTGTKKDKVHDTWQENIHFTHFHEDPEDAQRLITNQKLVNDHDKFVEYIRHVESKYKYHCHLQVTQVE